jgi:hypothetical protein
LPQPSRWAQLTVRLYLPLDEAWGSRHGTTRALTKPPVPNPGSTSVQYLPQVQGRRPRLAV